MLNRAGCLCALDLCVNTSVITAKGLIKQGGVLANRIKTDDDPHHSRTEQTAG